jgi:hypothetical protein
MWNETADSADPSPRQPDNRLVPLRTGTAVAEPVRESSGRYPDYGNEPEPDLASTLLFYWRIFIKRRWLILAILSAVVIIGAVKTLLAGHSPECAAFWSDRIDATCILSLTKWSGPFLGRLRAAGWPAGMR